MEFLSARLTERGACHDPAAPPHDRGPDPPQPGTPDDPRLHRLGRRFRPLLPRLARPARARARPLLSAPPDPAAASLLEHLQAGAARAAGLFHPYPGPGGGRRPGRPPPRGPKNPPFPPPAPD